MKRCVLSWSSGKDSAWALHLLKHDPSVELVGLLTTFNEAVDRVAMHAVRREIVETQAKAAGLPLWPVHIPSPCPNEIYEERMRKAMTDAKASGVTHVAFGDLFLEDIRRYREERLAPIGIEPLFPLWGRPTAALAREMIRGGLRATITCVDPKQLDGSFAGRPFETSTFPDGVDPCGERGEFHTCVTAGPMFDTPIATRSGEIVERDGFIFADVIAVSA
jgi:uncharacterized protein (TIGR00290 family)